MARVALVRKSYEYADGETGRSAKPGWQNLIFEFLAPEKDENANPVVLETREISRDEIPDEIADCALGHGLSQKLGDNLAGIAGKAAKEEPPVKADDERGFVDYALELFDDMWSDLEKGVWVAEGEGGKRGASVTILLEAIVAAFADAGKELDEDAVANIAAGLKDEKTRNAAKESPDVAKHMARIAAERAAARAEKAAKNAEKGESSIADLFGAA